MVRQEQVYALTSRVKSPPWGRVIKIGSTNVDARVRAKDITRLNAVPFEVLCATACANSRNIETQLHRHFKEHREGRMEFFRVSKKEVIKIFWMIGKSSGPLTENTFAASDKVCRADCMNPESGLAQKTLADLRAFFKAGGLVVAQSALAARWGVSKECVSTWVQAWEDRGLVSRIPDMRNKAVGPPPPRRGRPRKFG